MDPESVKGHFFLGQALLEIESFDEAIKHLQRGIIYFLIYYFFLLIIIILAHDLAKEQKRNFGDDIACLLRLGKKKRFAIQEERRIAQEIELQSHLSELLRKDRDTQLSDITEDIENLEDKRRNIEEQYDNCMTELNNIFAKIDERRRVNFEL